MTQKDYVVLAAALKEALALAGDDPALRAGVAHARQEVARTLACDNGRFNRDRFDRACGVSK